MFKYICAICFLSASLSAEVIGNVELSLPPSQYEWKSFWDNLSQFEEEASTDAVILAHREGDALELFISLQAREDEEDSAPSNLQDELIDVLGLIFPFHEWRVAFCSGTAEDMIIEWALNDGSVDLMHGYSRIINQGDSTTLLCYSTTAMQTDYNRTLWLNVMEEAKLLP